MTRLCHCEITENRNLHYPDGDLGSPASRKNRAHFDHTRNERKPGGRAKSRSISAVMYPAPLGWSISALNRARSSSSNEKMSGMRRVWVRHGGGVRVYRPAKLPGTPLPATAHHRQNTRRVRHGISVGAESNTAWPAAARRQPSNTVYRSPTR